MLSAKQNLLFPFPSLSFSPPPSILLMHSGCLCVCVCVWECIRVREVGDREDSPFFICLHKPHLFLQPDVSWQTSLSGPPLPFSLQSAPLRSPPPSPYHHPPTRRSGEHPTISPVPSTLPRSALQKMDVSLKQRLIVDIRVMAPFITADIIQTSGIEQGGGTLSPWVGFFLRRGCSAEEV